jgi:pimeloyl-ACP methyl ester carboxylesterase
MVETDNQDTKGKQGLETGYLENSLPYARIGTKPKILLYIDGLSFKNEPPSGFMLRQFISTSKPFLDEYSFYMVGRKRNMPEIYTFTDIAADYANMIRREFKGPVDVMGISTGGQIAHYLAADHPDVVKKLIIISAAYRLSEEGAKIERRTAEHYMEGKYGKAFAVLMDMMYPPGIRRMAIKVIMRVITPLIVGKVKYPSDFLIEIKGDCEMNFKDRLGEIQAPTLILCGETDIGYSIKDVRETAQGIPNAKLIIYEKYGHDLNQNNGKQVRLDALEFLRQS